MGLLASNDVNEQIIPATQTASNKLSQGTFLDGNAKIVGATAAPKVTPYVEAQTDISNASLHGQAIAKMADTVSDALGKYESAAKVTENHQLELDRANLALANDKIIAETKEEALRTGKYLTPTEFRAKYDEGMKSARNSSTSKYTFLGDDAKAQLDLTTEKLAENTHSNFTYTLHLTQVKNNNGELLNNLKERSDLAKTGGNLSEAFAINAQKAEVILKPENVIASFGGDYNQAKQAADKEVREGMLNLLVDLDPSKRKELLVNHVTAVKAGTPEALMLDPLRGIDATTYTNLSKTVDAEIHAIQVAADAKAKAEQSERETYAHAEADTRVTQYEMTKDVGGVIKEINQTNAALSNLQTGGADKNGLSNEYYGKRIVALNNSMQRIQQKLDHDVEVNIRKAEIRQRQAERAEDKRNREIEKLAPLRQVLGAGKLPLDDHKVLGNADDAFDMINGNAPLVTTNPKTGKATWSNNVLAASDQWGYTPRGVRNQVQSMYRSNDPNVSAQSVMLGKQLTDRDPELMDQLPKPLQQAIQASNMGVPVATTRLNQAELAKNPTLYSERKQYASTTLKPNIVDKKFNKVFPSLSFNKKPEEATVEFKKNAEDYYASHGDWDDAMEFATKKVTEKWSTTTTSGQPKLMADQPNRFGVDMQSSENAVANQLSTLGIDPHGVKYDLVFKGKSKIGSPLYGIQVYDKGGRPQNLMVNGKAHTFAITQGAVESRANAGLLSPKAPYESQADYQARITEYANQVNTQHANKVNNEGGM